MLEIHFGELYRIKPSKSVVFVHNYNCPLSANIDFHLPLDESYDRIYNM